jgi:hypothetical protein
MGRKETKSMHSEVSEFLLISNISTKETPLYLFRKPELNDAIH